MENLKNYVYRLYTDSKLSHLIEKLDFGVLKDKLKINFVTKSYF